MNLLHKSAIASMALGVFAFSAAAVQAAAPDGTGPWADSVVASSQGDRKDNTDVLADRSDPSAVLGAAESSGGAVDPSFTPGTFFSLGFGGSLTIGFTNSIVNGAGNDLKVFEVTVGDYPDEKIKVEVSPNGVAWTTLANPLTRDGEVDLGSLQCVQFVRLTDVSNEALFEATADGYDVDAVQALNSSAQDCDGTPWKGAVKSHGFWKTHNPTVTSWSGLSDGPVKGNACQNLANQAIGFLNNWNANPSFNGVEFQDTFFDSNGLSSFDGKSMQEIFDTLNSYNCATSSANLLALKDVLDWINNGKYIVSF